MQVIRNRRAFIVGLAGALMGARRLAQGSSSTEVYELRIDAERLQRTLEELSAFGRPAGGTFADGVSRVAYSDADVAGRSYVMGLMRDAGLASRIDSAGNLIGRRAGREPARLPILM